MTMNHPMRTLMLLVEANEAGAASYARSRANEFGGVPVIYKVKLSIHHPYYCDYGIRMERLTPHSNTPEIQSLIDYMGSRMGRSNYTISKERASAYRKAYPRLNAALNLIKGLLKYDCVGDFKYTNVMMRGDVPVIIDPVANKDDLE